MGGGGWLQGFEQFLPNNKHVNFQNLGGPASPQDFESNRESIGSVVLCVAKKRDQLRASYTAKRMQDLWEMARCHGIKCAKRKQVVLDNLITHECWNPSELPRLFTP